MQLRDSLEAIGDRFYRAGHFRKAAEVYGVAADEAEAADDGAVARDLRKEMRRALAAEWAVVRYGMKGVLFVSARVLRSHPGEARQFSIILRKTGSPIVVARVDNRGRVHYVETR